MKKKILTFLTFIFISFSMLTGCGSLMGEESLVIESLTTELLSDGRTKIIITYTDETIAPVTFYIPKGDTGEQGEKGDGIKKITHSQDPISGNVTVTIELTNGEEPVTYTLTNGVSVSNIETRVDEKTGTTYMKVNYSDGTSSEEIAIPKGQDGKGIIGYTQVPNEEDGSSTLVIMFSDNTSYDVKIPAPERGEQGRGILAIVSNEDENYYYVTFYYTDETEETIYFSKPEKPNEWYYGASNPANTLGKDGDFYYNTETKTIFHNENGTWVEVFSYEDTLVTCEVKFYLNGVDAVIPAIYNQNLTYQIQKGTNFASHNYPVPIPIARDPQYVFNGWYTEPDNITIVNGSFNDLTTVSTDMKLYANWIINE